MKKNLKKLMVGAIATIMTISGAVVFAADGYQSHLALALAFVDDQAHALSISDDDINIVVNSEMDMHVELGDAYRDVAQGLYIRTPIEDKGLEGVVAPRWSVATPIPIDITLPGNSTGIQTQSFSLRANDTLSFSLSTPASATGVVRGGITNASGQTIWMLGATGVGSVTVPSQGNWNLIFQNWNAGSVNTTGSATIHSMSPFFADLSN